MIKNIQVGKTYRLTDQYWYDEYVVGKEVVYMGDRDGNLDCVLGGSVAGFLSCGGVTEHHIRINEDNWCLHFMGLEDILEEIVEEPSPKVEIASDPSTEKNGPTFKPELGKSYRLINTRDYTPAKLNKTVTVHTLEENGKGGYKGFLSCGGVTQHHTNNDDNNWCLYFNNMQDCLEEIKEETEMKLIPQVGKEYYLKNGGGYALPDGMVVTLKNVEKDYYGRYVGFICGGDIAEEHEYIDDYNFCLFSIRLEEYLEEIPAKEHKMKIKKKQDGTYRVALSHEELLFLTSAIGWVGGDPSGSRRHSDKFYALACEYLTEEELEKEIYKYDLTSTKTGLYVRDGQ